LSDLRQKRTSVRGGVEDPAAGPMRAANNLPTNVWVRSARYPICRQQAVTNSELAMAINCRNV
jgi:hypothetical protein